MSLTEAGQTGTWGAASRANSCRQEEKESTSDLETAWQGQEERLECWSFLVLGTAALTKLHPAQGPGLIITFHLLPRYVLLIVDREEERETSTRERNIDPYTPCPAMEPIT